MSDASTGFWSALGAVVGGAAGATAGYYAEQYRPRARHVRRTSTTVEDAMVVGGATGAVAGAFIGGMLAGNKPTPPQLK